MDNPDKIEVALEKSLPEVAEVLLHGTSYHHLLQQLIACHSFRAISIQTV